MKSKWKFLSYHLNDKLSGYGNGKRIEIEKVRQMCCGDTSNNSEIALPAHFGTHIDFPFHFYENGKKLDDYSAEDFIFNQVALISIEEVERIEDYLVKPEHLEMAIDKYDQNIEFLILKTGFCNKREEESYWKYGYGIGLGVAKLLKDHFPRLKGIGFDLISLNSFQQRETGRIAHKEFLKEEDILILEDMDLREVKGDQLISELIVSPLLVSEAEGTPVTVFAKIVSND